MSEKRFAIVRETVNKHAQVVERRYITNLDDEIELYSSRALANEVATNLAANDDNPNVYFDVIRLF